MLITIPDVLTAEQVITARKLLDEAEWVDGRVTAGHQSARAKDNLQIPEAHPAGAGQEPAFSFRGAAVARFPAALQSLFRRPVVRHPRR
jgi:predicted 2-oxoglutarate/Fe(II)-dependent dioxygenase YbiX